MVEGAERKCNKQKQFENAVICKSHLHSHRTPQYYLVKFENDRFSDKRKIMIERLNVL